MLLMVAFTLKKKGVRRPAMRHAIRSRSHLVFILDLLREPKIISGSLRVDSM